MNIVIKGKEVDLRFGFNSFKYMQDLDMTKMQELESKPFMVLGMVETLLLGAVNHNPKERFSLVDVQVFLEKYMEEESLPDLLEHLMALLQESSFFKSLQKSKSQK